MNPVGSKTFFLLSTSVAVLRKHKNTSGPVIFCELKVKILPVIKLWCWSRHTDMGLCNYPLTLLSQPQPTIHRKWPCLTHQWSSSDTFEVVEETFGVIDGGTKYRVWFTPLTVQVLTVEITAIPKRSHRMWTNMTLLWVWWVSFFGLIYPTIALVKTAKYCSSKRYSPICPVSLLSILINIFFF